MNLKNIIAALTVVAATTTSVAAMAQGQVVVRDHRTEQPVVVKPAPVVKQPATVIVRDHRTERPPVIVKPAPVVVKQPTVIVRDHRTEDHRNDGRNDGWNHIHPIPAPQPVGLQVTATRIGAGMEEFNVGGDKAGRFNTIELTDVGRPQYVGTISVKYLNGETQTFAYNGEIAPGQCLTYDLASSNRIIERVLVSGSANPGALRLTVI